MASEYLAERKLPPFVRSTAQRLTQPLPERPGASEPSPLRRLSVIAGAQGSSSESPGAYRRLDTGGRLSVTALCTELGWDDSTVLRACPDADAFVLKPCDRPGGRGSLSATVDSAGRVRLPRAVCDRLDPERCGQLFARARNGHLELYRAGLIDDLLDAHRATASIHAVGGTP